MWPRSTEVFPALDVAIENVSPRSRLFALPPAELGTDRVEGLISYITRLARAHAVRPRSLIRREFVKACRSPEQLRCSARHSRDVRTMDGLGPYAEIFAALTAELTTVPAVRHLTLLPLADLLPRTSAGVIASRSRWCPDCLAEMTAAGGEVWRPLLWSLDLYQFCHQHRRPLVAHCGTCGKVQPFLPLLPELGHCPYCKAPLSGNHRDPTDPEPTEIDISVAGLLADLVAHLPELDGIATRARFVGFLKAAVEDVTGGNRVAFCERVGLRRWAIKNWLTRDQKPSLPQLVSLALGTGVSVPAMFQLDAACSSPPASPRPAVLRNRTKHPRLSEARRRALATTLAKIVSDHRNAGSAAEVARSIGLTASSLRYWFPEACAAICAKHVKARRDAVKRRREADYRVVGDVVREIARRGEYPGRRKVNEVLAGRHLSLAQPDMMEAYKTALQDLCGGHPEPKALTGRLIW